MHSASLSAPLHVHADSGVSNQTASTRFGSILLTVLASQKNGRIQSKQPMLSMPPDTPRRSLHALPPGTVLHDYVIDSQLGSGGFSIVYLARHHLNSDWLFAIKEYLPRELAVRDNDSDSVHPIDTQASDAFEDGLRRFRDEAEQLRKFRNEPYIVSCLNYIEGNATAYLVMDYDDGLPLSEFLRRREDAGRPFTEKDMFAVVEPLLEGLTVVHRAGVLHRDIKPGNIFVRRQDDITGRPAHPVLIDFGAAKQNYLARHSRSRAPYTPGYAAYEQVSSIGETGPWTDLYSLGAVMWRMVAGGCPDDSKLFVPDESDGIRAEELVWNPSPREVEKRAYALNRGWPDPMPPAVDLGARRFSPHVLEAIDRCLAQYPENRVQDCDELSELLQGRQSREKRSGFDHPRDSSMSGSVKGHSHGLKAPPKVGDKLSARSRPFPGWWLGVGVPLVILTIAAVLILPVDDTLPGSELISAQEPPDAEVGESDESEVFMPSLEQLVDEVIAARRQSESESESLPDPAEVMAAYERGDYAVALQGLRIHAELGYSQAQQMLGFMYAFGEGVSKDDVEAAHWFRLAAEQGLSRAQLRLGYMYASGQGVAEDDVEAVRLWHLAAAQGNALAQYGLGAAYREGEGVPANYAEAARWWRLAAEQGVADAQYGLGMMYFIGDGVAQDIVESYTWFSVAEAQGHSQARELKEIAALGISQSQINEAQQRSREYWALYVVPFR